MVSFFAFLNSISHVFSPLSDHVLAMRQALIKGFLGFPIGSIPVIRCRMIKGVLQKLTFMVSLQHVSFLDIKKQDISVNVLGFAFAL